MKAFNTKLEVREKGGALPQTWTSVRMVLTKPSLSYWLLNENGQNKQADPTEVVPLDSIDAIVMKNRSGSRYGFIFEIKAGKKGIQHSCPTEEDRKNWATLIEHTKAGEYDGPSSSASEDSGECLATPSTPRAPFAVVVQPSHDSAKREEHSMSTEELDNLLSRELAKNFQKNSEKLLKEWKEEKSEILQYMLTKELEMVEANYKATTSNLSSECQKIKDTLLVQTSGSSK